MTCENFCFWLQGFFEMQPPNTVDKKLVLSPEQVEMIRQHLQLVFKNVTAPVVKTVTPFIPPDIGTSPITPPWQGPWCTASTIGDVKAIPVC